MNIGIYFKVLNRLSTVFQGLVYPFFFNGFGRGTRILRPRRLDGSHRISLGKNVFINNDSWIETINAFDKEPEIIIGDCTYIGNSSHIISTQSIVIGSNVLIADRVYLADYSHGYKNISVPIVNQPLERRSVVKIGGGSWIGEGVVVIGASIGKNCVIGANSVVTRDVPDFSLAVGCPAKVIKNYRSDIDEWVSVN